MISIAMNNIVFWLPIFIMSWCESIHYKSIQTHLHVNLCILAIGIRHFSVSASIHVFNIHLSVSGSVSVSACVKISALYFRKTSIINMDGVHVRLFSLSLSLLYFVIISWKFKFTNIFSMNNGNANANAIQCTNAKAKRSSWHFNVFITVQRWCQSLDKVWLILLKLMGWRC